MDEHLLRFDKKATYVFIDCETENLCLNSFHNLAWQVGMLKVVGDEVVGEKDFYVNWNRPLHVSKEAARITKFSPKKHRERAIDFQEVFPTIEDWLDNADYVAGHNLLGFDLYLIKAMYEEAGKSYHHITKKIIDTLPLARGIKVGDFYKQDEDLLSYQYRMLSFRKKGLKTNLMQLGKDYEIDFDPDTLHDAVNDLKLNVAVWNKLKWQIEI